MSAQSRTDRQVAQIVRTLFFLSESRFWGAMWQKYWNIKLPPLSSGLVQRENGSPALSVIFEKKISIKWKVKLDFPARQLSFPPSPNLWTPASRSSLPWSLFAVLLWITHCKTPWCCWGGAWLGASCRPWKLCAKANIRKPRDHASTVWLWSDHVCTCS